MSAGGAETVTVAVGVVQIVHGQKFHGFHFLDEQLGDAVALLDEMFAVGMIEQEDFDFPAVLGIDDARAAIEAVLGGEAAAGPDETDVALR